MRDSNARRGRATGRRTAVEALVLAVPDRRAGGECHLLQRGAVSPGARATPTLPDRLGIGRRLLDLPGVLRVGAADSLRAAGSELLPAARCRIRMTVSFMKKAIVLVLLASAAWAETP